MNQAPPVFVGSDNDVNWRGLRAARTSSTFENNATVTFAIYASEANALAETNPITGTSGTCDYITGSNGDYLGTLSEDQTEDLTLGTTYWLGVKAVTGDGLTDRRAIPYTARGRRGR